MRDGDAAEVGLHPLRAGLLQQLALLQIEADGWRAECEDAVRLREQLQSAVDEATLHMHRLKSAGTTVHGPGASPNGRTTEGAEMARDGEMSWGDFFGLLLRAVHREKAGLLQHIASARAGVEERRRRCTAAAADAAAEGRRRREEEAKAEHWRTTLERERAECERIEREVSAPPPASRGERHSRNLKHQSVNYCLNGIADLELTHPRAHGHVCSTQQWRARTG